MKRMTLLMLIALMFSMSGVIQAQTDFPVVCGDLADADCDILRQNQQAMLGLDSYNFAFSADLTIANFPDMPGNVSFLLSGTGAVSGETSILAMTPEEATAMMANAQAYAAYVERIFDAVDMEMSLLLKLPEALVEETGGELPGTIALDVVLADGVGYINFDSLRGALGAAGESLPEGWYGLDIAGLVGEAMAMTAAMGSFDTLEMMDPDLMAQFADPDFLNNFMRIERLDDTATAEGAPVASFHTVVDYQALMTDPTMRALMLQSVEAQGLTLSAAELDEFDLVMSQMFQGLTLNIFTTIGLDDYYTRSTQVVVNFNLASMMALMASSGSTPTEGRTPSIMFNINLLQSEFNQVGTIAAPGNATIIPLESLGMGGTGTMPPSGAAPLMAEPTATTEG